MRCCRDNSNFRNRTQTEVDVQQIKDIFQAFVKMFVGCFFFFFSGHPVQTTVRSCSVTLHTITGENQRQPRDEIEMKLSLD